MLLAIDLLIAFTLIEVVALWLWHRSGRGGVAPGDMLPNMASGLCLMAALRCALAGFGWPLIALWVCGSGLAHGWDLVRRWKHKPPDAAGVLKSHRATGDPNDDPEPAPSSSPITRVQAR
jgi:hypothetical protein